MDEGVGTQGLSRRDLIKRSAVAGGLVWAAPLLQSSPAFALHAGAGAEPTCHPDCDQCSNGVRIYGKFSPGDSKPSAGSNCLNPAEPTVKVSFGDLVCANLIQKTDDVQTNVDFAAFKILQPSVLRVIRTSIKAESACFVSCCEDGFETVTKYSSSHKPPEDDECSLSGTARTPVLFTDLAPKTRNPKTLVPGPTDPLFRLKTGASVACGSSPSPAPDPCCEGPTEIRYSTESLPKGGTVSYDNTGDLSNEKLNFIEVVFCFTGGTSIPGCNA